MVWVLRHGDVLQVILFYPCDTCQGPEIKTSLKKLRRWLRECGSEMPLSELYVSSRMESRVMHLSPGCPLRRCDNLRARKHLLNFRQFMLELFDENFSLTQSLQQHLPWGPAHRRQVTQTRYRKSESLACRLDAV